MNKKFLLVYILFFLSINTMAALASVDCKTAPDGTSAHHLQEHHLQCSIPNQTTDDDALQVDKARDSNFINPHLNNREQSVSGALSFILLIPALLVFVFSGFEKSNK